MLIGITGKSAGGKNYVSEILEKRGWVVLDLDKICHALYTEKEKALKAVFGTTERKIISKAVFESAEKLKELENILYPALFEIIRTERLKAEEQGKIIAINGSLLHRATLDAECDYIIYVDATYEERLRRAMARDGISKDAFDARNASQKDVDFRDATYRAPLLIIDNNSLQLKGLDEAISIIESGQRIK